MIALTKITSGSRARAATVAPAQSKRPWMMMRFPFLNLLTSAVVPSKACIKNEDSDYSATDNSSSTEDSDYSATDSTAATSEDESFISLPSSLRAKSSSATLSTAGSAGEMDVAAFPAPPGVVATAVAAAPISAPALSDSVAVISIAAAAGGDKRYTHSAMNPSAAIMPMVLKIPFKGLSLPVQEAPLSYSPGPHADTNACIDLFVETEYGTRWRTCGINASCVITQI
eukprot:gene15719-21838_t